MQDTREIIIISMQFVYYSRNLCFVLHLTGVLLFELPADAIT